VRPGEVALASGYFAYFAAVGVFQPYWPVRLAALGLTSTTIGLMLALVSAVRVVGPVGTAWLADRCADRRLPIRVLALAAAAANEALAPAHAQRSPRPRRRRRWRSRSCSSASPSTA
jgi:MFS transporter, PPP family, 3-phenylpropionic acid transporter